MMSSDRNTDQKRFFKLMDGDVRVWIEQEAIHLIAIDRSSFKDPVELTSTMAIELAEVLLGMASQLKD